MGSPNFVPRNVAIISLYIVSRLPDDQVSFKNDIMDFVKKQLVYVSPENMGMSTKWQLLDNIMKRYIQEIDAPWKQEIVDIYIGNIKVPE